MKLDRLMGILTILMQRDRVTAPYLAERFEVSRRTITRDLDALCRAGIPVVTVRAQVVVSALPKAIRWTKAC